MGAWKSVRAEDRGPLSAFAAHPYAPLVATASLSQNTQVTTHQLLLPILFGERCCSRRHLANCPQLHVLGAAESSVQDVRQSATMPDRHAFCHAVMYRW